MRPIHLQILLLLICSMTIGVSHSQEVWTLQRCIEYAKQNSLNIKQAAYGVELAEVGARQSRLERLPSVSGSAAGGIQWGRTIDPTTNDFNNQRISYNSYSLNARMLIYGGGMISNGIKQSQADLEAARYDADYAFNITALGIANAYLQILQAQEQLDVARRRVELSRQQLEQTDKLIEAGVLPANNRLDILAQLARDEQALVQAENLLELNYLTLKDLMYLDLSTEIKVEAPPVDVPADMNPDNLSFLELYQQALGTQPQIKAEEYRLQSAALAEQIARAALLPTVAAFASVDTRWSSAAKRITGFEDDIQEQTVYIDNTPVTVGFPVTVPLFEDNPYFDQIDQNFGQGVGLSVSIPIFSNGRNSANVQRAEIGTKTALVRSEQAKQQLRNDIQQALMAARAAKRSYEAAKLSYEAAKAAFDNAQKRFDLGAINAFEYNTARNTLDMAQNELTSSKYDYIFRLKILDFYLGKELRIN